MSVLDFNAVAFSRVTLIVGEIPGAPNGVLATWLPAMAKVLSKNGELAKVAEFSQTTDLEYSSYAVNDFGKLVDLLQKYVSMDLSPVATKYVFVRDLASWKSELINHLLAECRSLGINLLIECPHFSFTKTVTWSLLGNVTNFIIGAKTNAADRELLKACHPKCLSALESLSPIQYLVLFVGPKQDFGSEETGLFVYEGSQLVRQVN